MTAIVVRPVRFTDNIEAMREFLQMIGLRVRIESQRGGWYDLVAGAGMVALHTAADSAMGHAQGETCLSFEADDCEIVAEQLRSAGVPDVVVYDEAYGQVLTCTDPQRRHDRRRRPLARPLRLHPPSSPPRRAAQRAARGLHRPAGSLPRVHRQFGFTRAGHADEYFATCAGDGDAGLIGLHYVYDGQLPIVPGPAAVHLTFTTTEPIDDVAARLTAAGYDPTRHARGLRVRAERHRPRRARGSGARARRGMTTEPPCRPARAAARRPRLPPLLVVAGAVADRDPDQLRRAARAGLPAERVGVPHRVGCRAGGPALLAVRTVRRGGIGPARSQSA